MEKKHIQLAAAVATAIALTPTVLGNNQVKADTPTTGNDNKTQAGTSSTNVTKNVDGAVVTVASGTQTVAQTVTVYSSAGHPTRTLKAGETVTVQGTAMIGGNKCFYLGLSEGGVNEFALATAFTAGGSATTTPSTNQSGDQMESQTQTGTETGQTGTLTVTAKDGTHVFDKSGVGDGKVLDGGTQHPYFGTLDIGGTKYFDIGNGEYVNAEDVQAVPGTPSAKPSQPSTTTPAQKLVVTGTTKGAVTITAAQTYVHTANGASNGRALAVGTSWKTFGTVTIGNEAYYDLGGGQYVAQNAVKVMETPKVDAPATNQAPVVQNNERGVVTVTGAQAYVFANTGASTGRVLAVGSSWKTFGTVAIGGQPYYDLGGGQYVSQALVQVATPAAPEQQKAPDKTQTSQTNGVLTVIKGDTYVFNNAGASSGRILSTGSQWKYFGTVKIGGNPYYDLGGGQYISADNAVVTAAIQQAEKPADTQPTITPYTGTITIGNGAAATVYDHKGTATVRTLPKQTSWKVFGTTTIGGVAYYSVGGDQFVRLSDVETQAHSQEIGGQVKIAVARTFLLTGDGSGVVLNEDHTIRTLERGTTWKVFGEIKFGNQHLYDLGGGQYVDAQDVDYTAADEVAREAQPVERTGTVRINYVEGYGVQIWHRNGSLVTDAQGKAVKLMHGTTWKIFAVLAKDGHDWYSLGGDQWIDGSYVQVF